MKWIILLLLLLLTGANCEFPKILWTYWKDGLQSSPIIKAFNMNHRKFAEASGWQVRFIDENLVIEYIKVSPLYSQKQYKELKTILAPVALSDYIRCLLIIQYGGVYLDMTSILIEDLSWLNFDNLRKNPDVLNKYGDQPEILLFTFHDYGKEQKHFDAQLNRSFIVRPTYEIWFIAAVPNSTFFLQYCPQLIKVYLDGGTNSLSLGYNRFHQRLKEEGIGSDVLKSHGKYLISLDIINAQLIRKQRSLDKISQQTNSSRQLPAWHYKAWHIPAQRGPYNMLYYYYGSTFYYLSHYSQQQLQENEKISYFVKGISFLRTQLYNLLIERESLDAFTKSISYFQCFFFSIAFCTVYKNSMFYKFMITEENQQYFRISQQQFFAGEVKMRMFLLIVIILVLICVIVRQFKRKKQFIKVNQTQTGQFEFEK